MLPPVIAKIVTDAKDARADIKAYGADVKKTFTEVAKVAEAEATRMEAAAKKAAATADAAAQKAAAAAEQVVARSNAATARAMAQADKAAAELDAAYGRTEALMASNTASAAETDAAVRAEAVAMERLQAAALKANEAMAKGAVTTAQAMERAAAVADLGAKKAAEATAVATAARAEADKAAAAVTGSSARSAAALGGLKKASDKALLGVAGTAAFVGFESLKMAGNFQQSVTLLKTGAGESAQNLQMVGDGMKSMAGDVGVSVGELGKAMYYVESAGHHGADGLEVLRAAAQGAKTDGADVTETADALTTVLEDLGKKAGPPAEMMSKMVAAVGQGKMKMNDFAGSIHSVLPNAAALGISFEDVAGALATMTAQGVSADQAAQNLNHVIVSLANPTAVMTKAMAAYGVSSLDVQKNLGKQGLTKTLDELFTAVMKQTKGGVAMQSAFMANKAAARSMLTEYVNLPPAVQKLADAYTKGTITGKQYLTAIHDMPQDAAVLGAQFKKTADNASGFSQALRSGQGDLQSTTAAFAQMTGGQTGLQVMMHLTGGAAEETAAKVKLIGAATADADGNVKDFEETQKNLNNQLASAKAALGAVGVTIGTELIPPVSAALGFFKEHTTVLKVMAGVVGGVAVALAAYSVAMKVAAAAQGTWTTATKLASLTLGGPWRMALTAAAIGLGYLLQQHQKAASRVAELTEAIKADSGAFGENTRQKIVNSLESDGVLKAAQSLGIALPDLTNALLGNADAQKRVNDTLDYAKNTGVWKSGDIGEYAANLKRVQDAMSGGTGSAKEAMAAYQRQKDAIAEASKATDGDRKSVDSLTEAQKRMQAALDSSNNRLLAAHQAESAYYAAVDDMTAALKENGHTLDVHTASGRANREALDGLVKASLDRLQALKDSGAPAAAFNKALQDEKTALANAAGQATTSKTEIQKYVDQLGLIPKQVDTTVTVSTAASMERVALLQAALTAVGAGNRQALQKAAQLAGHAAGGLIPGSPSRVDNLLVDGPEGPTGLATGEFVVNSEDTSRNLGLLQAINSGKRVLASYAAGGAVQHLASGGLTVGDAARRSAAASQMLAAVSSGGSSGSKRTSRAKLSASAKQAAADLKSAMSSVTRWIPAGIAQAVERGRDAAIKEIQTLGVQVSKAHNGFVNNLVKTSGASLIKLGTTYDALGTKLKSAQASLKQLQEDSAKLAADTASKIISGGDITAINATTGRTDEQQAAIDKANKGQVAAEKAALAAEAVAANAATSAQHAQERYNLSKKTASDQLTLKFAQEAEAAAQAKAAAARAAADQAGAAATAANQASGGDGAAAMIANLHKQIQTATQFGQALAELKKDGLDATSLSQIAAAGPEAGLATANALLAGGKTAIDQVAALQKQLALTATQSGKQVADSMYASGIAAAQGLVKGLASQESTVLAQINKMVNAMIAAVKKNLKIKSPSQKTAKEVGSPMGASVGVGFVDGITAALPDVHAALGSMATIPGSTGFSVGGIPRVGGTTAVTSGPMVATVPIVLNLDGKTVWRGQRTVTLQHQGRNSGNGLSFNPGR